MTNKKWSAFFHFPLFLKTFQPYQFRIKQKIDLVYMNVHFILAAFELVKFMFFPLKWKTKNSRLSFVCNLYLLKKSITISKTEEDNLNILFSITLWKCWIFYVRYLFIIFFLIPLDEQIVYFIFEWFINWENYF